MAKPCAVALATEAIAVVKTSLDAERSPRLPADRPAALSSAGAYLCHTRWWDEGGQLTNEAVVVVDDQDT
jgi:hypothetical protein